MRKEENYCNFVSGKFVKTWAIVVMLLQVDLMNRCYPRGPKTNDSCPHTVKTAFDFSTKVIDVDGIHCSLIMPRSAN